MIAFGLSTSYWMAVATRSLSGLLNGNIGVAKSVLGEITDKTNQSRAFSVFGFVYGLGFIGMVCACGYGCGCPLLLIVWRGLQLT